MFYHKRHKPAATGPVSSRLIFIPKFSVKFSVICVLFQESLGFNRCHASGTGGGDRLTIAAVLHISASVDTVHTRQHIIMGFEIAVRVGLELAFKHLRVRLM